MIRGKDYEKPSKFVKVTAKLVLILFSGHGVVKAGLVNQYNNNCTLSVRPNENATRNSAVAERPRDASCR